VIAYGDRDVTNRICDSEGTACAEFLKTLLRPQHASFIDPLLRFGHVFGLVEIPTGAGRFCGFVFRQVKKR
jgi:hypothetical protein